MSIIHNYSDREQKKLNIKIYSFIAMIVGALALTYTLASTFSFKPSSKENPQTQSTPNQLCIDKRVSVETYNKIEEYGTSKNLPLTLTREGINCKGEIVRNPVDINPYRFSNYTMYVIVTNPKNKLEEISIEKLTQGLNAQKYDKYTLLWNLSADEFLRSKFEFGVGQTVYSDSEIAKKVTTSQNFIAIVPFEKLNPTFKLLKVGTNDIFSDTLTIAAYPLTDTFWYKAESEYEEILSNLTKEILPKPNFETGKITKLILTGSSMVGSDAYNVNIVAGQPSDYMIKNIQNEISQDDFLHISNEVSIYTSCFQKVSSTFLCSLEKDFSPIKKLGVNVVGVSGNHIMDFGYSTFINTLDWYSKNKIAYFGGGKNESQSQSPTIVNHKGLKIALLGYNFIPPYSYYARGNNGGSSNVSFSIMEKGIKEAKSRADIVIVDMNWGDELQTRIDNTQREYAQKAIEYGATIVNGVNSYTILGADIKSESTTFYGLGGFLNPQSSSGIMVYHYFYENKYIGYTPVPITSNKEKILQLAQGSIKDTMVDQLYKQTGIIYDQK